MMPRSSSPVRRALLLLLLAAAPFWAAAQEDVEFQSVVVKPGDTLWSIANSHLKDPSNWDQIVKYNRLPSADPTLALPGMTLRVPVRLIREGLRAARLIRVKGVLYSRKAAGWKAATENMELLRDDALKTSDGGSARVKFLDGDLLQLDGGSMAVIKPRNKDYAVELKRGGVFVGRAKLMTPAGTVTPLTKATKYAATVRNDLSTLVEVFSGKAAVAARGLTVEVGAGMASEIKMGLTPSAPAPIADLPRFAERIEAFEKNLEAQTAAAPLQPARAPAVAGTGPADFRSKATAIGEAVSGYRIQLSSERDFSDIAFDKIFPADEPIRASDIRVDAGRYWYRVAVIDLLGAQGRFAEPALYVTGAR